MQLQVPAAETLPVAVLGSGSRRVTACRDVWPDALSPWVLYRGAYFRAESPGTPRNARALVAAVLADWRLLPVLDDAVTCVSELVSNSVRHAVNPVVGDVKERRVSVGVRCWGGTALFL